MLAFIFIYVDIISRENGAHNNGDVVLLAIAVYATVFLVTKSCLAVYHHFKWMCCQKCCRTITDDKNRMGDIDKYW